MVSILRILRVSMISSTQAIYLFNEIYLGTNVGPGLWSASEVQVGVLCANLPPLRILLRRKKQDNSKVYDKREFSQRSDMSHDLERREALVVYHQTYYEVR